MKVIFERWHEIASPSYTNFTDYFNDVQSRYKRPTVLPLEFKENSFDEVYDPSKGRPFKELRNAGVILVSDLTKFKGKTRDLVKEGSIVQTTEMVDTAVLNYGQGAAVIDRYRVRRVYPISTYFRPNWDDYRKEIDSVVLRAHASANEGVIDLLTEIVELKGTLATPRAIIDAAAKLTRYKELLKRINQNRTPLSSHTERRLKQLLRKVKKGRKALNPFRKGSYASDVLDAWMLYRFGISPVLSTWEAVVDDLKQKERVYFSTAARTGIDTLVSEVKNGVTITTRIVGQARCTVRSEVGKPIRTAVLTNSSLPRTLWELVPQSWLVDRFINIGEYLTALDTPSEVKQRAATVSLRLSIRRKATVSYATSSSAIQWKIRSHGPLKEVRGVYSPVNHEGKDIEVGSTEAEFYERRCVGSLPVAPRTTLTVTDWNIKMFVDAFALFTQKIRS